MYWREGPREDAFLACAIFIFPMNVVCLPPARVAGCVGAASVSLLPLET